MCEEEWVERRLLAAVIIMNVGKNFTEMTVNSFEPSNESTVGMVGSARSCDAQNTRNSIIKGFKFSIVNVALIANHIALITASGCVSFV